MFKPKRVASTWQENISAQVQPRSENRWRVSRPQPLLATLLQFVMLLEQVKSVGSVPEAPLRDTTALVPVHGATALAPVRDATALIPAHDIAAAPVPPTAMIPVRDVADNARRRNWNIRDIPDVPGYRNIKLPMTKSLNNLPPELISTIGTYLPGQDIGRLSQVNRRLRDIFVQESQAGRFVMQAERVTRLSEFRALLGNPDDGGAGILGLRMSLRERPLAALISRIRILPGDERFAGFQRILDAVTADRFPMTARCAALTGLARKIRRLDADDRWAAFKLIHDAITIAGFPMAARAATLTELARQCNELNVGDRSTAFGLLHDAATAAAFPMAYRAAPLAGLALRIPDLPGPDRPDAFRRILSAVVKLDKQNRGAALEALAMSVICLPEHFRGPALYAAQTAIAELDLLDSGAPFDLLALSLSFLMMSDTSETLRLFVEQIDWLPDYRWTQMLGAFQRP